MNFHLHPNTRPVLVSRLSWPGTGHVLWQIGICDLPEHSEWMEGVRRPLANGKESGAKIRVEKTKAIINFGIMIGPVALNMVSMAIAAQKAVKTGEK